MLKLLLFTSIIISIGFNQVAISQVYSNHKSKVLEKKFIQTKSEFEKIKILNELSREYRLEGLLSKALEQGQKAENLAKKFKDSKGLAIAYLNNGTTMRELKKYDEAIKYLELLIECCEKNKDEIGKGNAYDNIGHIYYENRDTLNAIKYHTISLKIRKKAGDLYGSGNSSDNIAQIYAAQDDYLISIAYFEESLRIFKEVNDSSRIALSSGNLGFQYYLTGKSYEALIHLYQAQEYYKLIKNTRGEIWTYNLIANIYAELGEYKKALENYTKSVEKSRNSSATDAKIESITSLGRLYMMMGEYSKAHEYFKRALDLSFKSKDKQNITVSKFFIGENYRKEGKLNLALNKLTAALVLAKEINSRQWIASASERIGRIEFELGNYKKAKELILVGLELNKKSFSVRVLSENYHVLSKVNSVLGDHKGAYENYKLYDQYKDSLQKKESRELLIRNEYKQKEKEAISIQNKKEAINLKKIEEKSLERNTALIGLLLMTIIVFFVIYLFYLRNKNLKIEKSNLALKRKEVENAQENERFKSRFLANISHEFRTPLTLINGHLDLLKQKNANDDSDLNHLNEMENNSKRLLQLINQLLDLSKMESGKYILNYKVGPIITEINSHFQNFHSQAINLGINLSLLFSETVSAKLATANFIYSSEALASILSNLISNALKFTPYSGRIKVQIDYDDNKLTINVENSGEKIPEEHLNRLFDRFYQLDNSLNYFQAGTGIGLALLKELCCLHGGDISAKNIEEGGCVFIATILSSEENFQEIEINKEYLEGPDSDDIKSSDETEQPLILIVEDQNDLRKFIKECLGNSYKFLEAKNGKEGIEIAKEHMPDLIISDVMMPGISGYELCKALKNDSITSHIQIILLTAKAEQADRETGLEVGANDYIIKPFSVNELNLRVRNNLQNQQLLQQKFQHGLIPKQEDAPELSSRDRAFVEKIGEIINENISNYQLGVSFLAEEIALSSSQLTRKLKAITNCTPADFIKNKRMEKAILLLKNKESVTDVAWKVGFEDPAYFGKVFKRHFGYPPSEARNKYL